MPIGPSIPCACHCPGRTLHIPTWGKRELVFARRSYMQGEGSGVYWWFEWVPVTPLDGKYPHPRKARVP